MAELRTAATELDASYRGFVAASNSAQAAWSLVKLADSERWQSQIQTGDPQAGALARRSHNHYLEAAELARKTGSAAYLVKALIALALMEGSGDHDYGSANSRVTEALRAAASCPSRDCLADALGAKAEVEIGRGELFSAASHVNGWLALLKGDTEPSQLYYAYMDRADVFQGMARGCPTNYQKSLETCFRLFDLGKADLAKARDVAAQAGYAFLANTAASLIKEVEVSRTVTQSHNSITSLGISGTLFAPKTPKDVLVTEIQSFGFAQEEIEAVRALLATAGPATPDFQGIWLKAQMDDIEGRSDAALDGYLRAIRRMDEDRRKLGEDSARSAFLNDKINVYERPVLLLLEKKRFAEAFELLDRSRARATADLLATRSLGLSKQVDRKLFATVALKRAEIASGQAHFFSLDSGFLPGADDPETVAKLQTHLADLEADYEQLLRRIAGEAPRAQDVALSQPVTLATLQNALRQDSADLLYYHLTDAGIILIHIGPNSFHARNAFLPRFLVTSKATALLDSMRRKGFPFREDLAKELFLYLVQPAMGWLSTDHLIVIPQAELQALPFQALMDPADGTFLGERFQVSYAPSAWILLQLKKQRNLAGGSLLAASEPSLQSARKEVKAVASLYPARSKVLTDSLVRKADFQQWAGSYDIIHLAVHGKFDAEEPLLSTVKLAPGGGEEGDLTAAEMFGLPLEKARLVTLSACETGRVRTTRSNEIQGIQQALLFAGAQSLLVSAWQVDDDATSLWMQTFYREAQTKTPAEAAREAIRTVRRDARYSHPFYWAPFVLVAR